MKMSLPHFFLQLKAFLTCVSNISAVAFPAANTGRRLRLYSRGPPIVLRLVDLKLANPPPFTPACGLVPGLNGNNVPFPQTMVVLFRTLRIVLKRSTRAYSETELVDPSLSAIRSPEKASKSMVSSVNVTVPGHHLRAFDHARTPSISSLSKGSHLPPMMMAGMIGVGWVKAVNGLMLFHGCTVGAKSRSPLSLSARLI